MGNEKSKGTFYSSAANKKYMNSKKKHIKNNKNNSATPIKLNSFRFYPINGKTITMNTTARYLPPRDVIYNLALDYLEIYDINNLAQSCKLIYYWLFCDHDPKNGFWKRIARRDQFSQFKEELSDDDCRKMYWKLSTCRLVFEKDLYCLESQYYSMSNIRSESHIKFREFVKAIYNDFGQLKYILRNRRRNILTRAYVTVYGLDGSWDDRFYYEKKDELAMSFH